MLFFPFNIGTDVANVSDIQSYDNICRPKLSIPQKFFLYIHLASSHL